MPATGESGFDLYCWDNASQSYRWVALWTTAAASHSAINRPASNNATRGEHQQWPTTATGSLTGVAPLPALEAGASREFILYLPLYNGVEHVSIGVEDGATLLPSPRHTPRAAPVVFYGTSITQGGVVSRPGMAFTNMIGRSLSRDVLNFGYSGQGYMEISVASFLVKVEDTGAFVIARHLWPPIVRHSSPHFLCRLVSLPRRVLPYKHRKMLRRLYKLMKLCLHNIQWRAGLQPKHGAR